MNYEVLDLVQGSMEWKKARLEHVTASNVPAILGISPYKTALEYATELLTGQELDESESKEFIFQKGHAIEAAGREWCRANLGVDIVPQVVRSLDRRYLMASLDGLDSQKGIVFEAKYVGRDALNEIKSGKLKVYHDAQVQAQLLATGFEKAIYFAMDPDGDAAVVDIVRKPDHEKKLAATLDKFWKDLKEGTLPKASPKDILQVEDPQLSMLAEMDAKLTAIQDEYDALKKEVLAKYEKNLRTIEGSGVVIQKAWRKGTIEWAKLAQAKGIDEQEQERFRKSGSLVTSVRIKKGA